MSTDQDKSGKAGGDRPVLFGPANDPSLSDRIEKLTGDALDGTIARLDAFADKMFSDTSEEDPFPLGVGAEEPIQPEVVFTAHAVESGDVEAADGLDKILDTLSEEQEPGFGSDPITDLAPKASLRDLERQFDISEEVLTSPTSPIGEVLARTGAFGAERNDVDYHDPGLEATGIDHYFDMDAGSEQIEKQAEPYEPLGLAYEYLGDDVEPLSPDDMDLLDLDEDMEDLPALSVNDTDSDPLGDIFPDEQAPARGSDTSGSDSSQGHGLPEPSPYGDQDGMGGLFGYADDDGEAERSADRDALQAKPDSGDTDVTKDWLMADQDEEISRTDPLPYMTVEDDRVEVSSASDAEPKDYGAMNESALDGLITDLRWGRADAKPLTADPDPVVADEPSDEPVREAGVSPKPTNSESLIPAFLRRDSSRPRLGDLSDRALKPVSLQAEVTQDVTHPNEVKDLFPAQEETGHGDEEIASSGDEPVQETPSRSGRKRLMVGVALVALVALTGAGAYFFMPITSGPFQVAQSPSSVFSTAPEFAATDTPAPIALGTGSPFTEADASGVMPFEAMTSGAGSLIAPSLAEQAPVNRVIVRAPLEELEPPIMTETSGEPPVVTAGDLPGGDLTMTETTPAATPGETVPPEVVDLLAQINRSGPDTATSGASSEQVEAIGSRLSDVEEVTAAAQDRAVEISNELTGLTDQITALLQRDSDQAGRLERMERLIRGQSAILAQFGQMEESLEQTQVVLLDVSARIGAVEGQNPADRDAVNRALSDVEGRLQALTANMSILARMSIEGVDALRAPGASSATVGVQTALQASDQRGGGTDTVFRSETGGFRISSDAAGRIPAAVKKDDFIEGYGYVLDVLPASDGQRLVVMENGSVLIPKAE